MSSLNAESAVVGMCLKDPKCWEEVVACGLTPSHFHDDKLGRAFACMVKLDSENKNVDQYTVGIELPDLAVFLIDAVDQSPCAQNVSYYVKEVLEAHACREIERLSRDLVTQASLRQPFQSLAGIESLRTRLAELDTETAAAKDEDYLISEIHENWVDETERAIVDFKNGVPPGIPTGIPWLDRMCNGFYNEALFILAARTSLGKTTLALNFAYNAMMAGKRVAFFTIEMSRSALYNKLVSRHSGVRAKSIKIGNLNEVEIDRVARRAVEIKDKPMYIFDSFNGRLDEMERILTRLKRKNLIDFAIVDYIQLMSTARHYESQTQKVTEITGRLKVLTRNLKIPILALAQINRDADRDDDGTGPKLRHLKDSGSIEQDADVVMAIYREESLPVQTWLKVMKNRDGLMEGACRLAVENDINLWQEAPRA